MEQELIAGLIESRGDSEARNLILGRFGNVDLASIELLKSEIDRLQRTDPHLALRLTETVSRIYSSEADPAAIALCWWAKANVLRELGDYAQALSFYDKAGRLFAVSGRLVDDAKTRIGKIDALMYLGRYDEASFEAIRTRRLLLKNREPLQAAKLDANMGNLFHRIDRYDVALRRYSRARRAFSQLGQDVMVAQVDVNRANVLTFLGRFSSALTAYQRARARFEADGMRAVAAMIDANMAFLFHQRGKYDKALELYVSSAETFRQLGVSKNAAVVDLDLAQVYLDLSMPSESLTLCANSLSCFEELGMRAELAQTLSTKAVGQMRLGEDYAALDSLDQARALYELEGNEVRIAFTDLHRAALMQRMQAGPSSLDEACRLATNAAAVFEQSGIPGKTGLAALILGQIYEAMGQVAEAYQSFTRALDCATKFNLPWLEHQALHLQGRLSVRVDRSRARAKFERSVQILETMRGELRSENARTFFLGDKLGAYQDLVLLLLESGESGAREAFQYVERAKSRALVDLLRGQLELRTKGEVDQRLAKRMQALQDELNWYYGRLDDGDTKGHRLSSQGLRHLAGEVESREKLLAQYAEQLQLTNPEYPGVDGAHTSLDDAQALLADDEALVEYFFAGDEILAFVVTSNGFHVKRGLSSPTTVSALSRRLAFQLSKFNYGECYIDDHFPLLLDAVDQCLSRLYDELFRPIQGLVADRKIIMVPHGELHNLPFHAFYDGERYILQRHEVSYAPSSAVLKHCLAREQRSLERCLLVGVSDAGVPQVDSEVEEICRFFTKPHRLIGRSATVKAVKEQACSQDIIHIATHALFSSGNPMFSRLKLADGWLNVYEIYKLRLEASLVALSSCQTGVGRIVGSDEIIGIARGFLYAGAASLLASLWAVNDRSTATLMKVFYRGLTQGRSKRASLREAQLETLAEYKHPYHWAPFVLIGRSC